MSIFQGTNNQDLIYGTIQQDSISALAGDDIVVGLEQNDLLFGNEGNDWLAGNQGADTVAGGKGNDTIQAGQGDDWILGQIGSDALCGDRGNDTVLGGDDNDWLAGNTGNDWLAGNTGNDTILGGVGNDTAHGGQESDLIDGQIGDDALCGDRGDDVIKGSTGNDLIFGNTGADWLGGNEENDTLYGGKDNDTLHGGKNNDLLFGDRGNDLVSGDLDDDIALGGTGNDVVWGGEGNDYLNGNEDNDTLYGGVGNDTAHGGLNNDVIYGGTGNDLLYGDIGADTLYGDEGDDTFVIGRRNDIPGYKTTGGPQLVDADWLNDFGTGRDTISLIGGLTYEQLNIFAGTGDYAGHTILQDRVLGEYLAIIKGVLPQSLVGESNLIRLKPPESANNADIPPPTPTTNGGEIPNNNPKQETPPINNNPQPETPPINNNPTKPETPPINNNPQPETPPINNNPQPETPPINNNPQPVTPPINNNPQPETPPINNNPKPGGNTTETKNHEPVYTGAKEFNILEDTKTTLPNPLLNAKDADGDKLQITSFSQPENGILTQNPDGSFSYTPNPNYNGVDKFTVTISDGKGGSTTTEIKLNITAVQDIVTAAGDNYTTNEDVALTNINPLANDKTTAGGSLKINNFTQPKNGKIEQNLDGTFTYTPNSKYHGSDQFTYDVEDSEGNKNTGIVSIVVNSVNENPVAVNDEYTIDEDTSYVLKELLKNDTDADGDKLTISSFTQPKNGSVKDNKDGTLTYAPNANFNGEDSFNYTVSDGNGGLTTATVKFTVKPVQDVPVAGNDTFKTVENTPVVISDLLKNDVDVDGDILTFEEVKQPKNGTVTTNKDGTFTYIPNQYFNGNDSFTYTFSDGNGNTVTGTVNIVVGSVNQPPEVTDKTLEMKEDEQLTLPNLLANAKDVDGDTLKITEFSSVNNGKIVDNQNGTFSYVPNRNFFGEEKIIYTVSDGTNSTTGTLTIKVNSVNDFPTITFISDQSTKQNNASNRISLTVGDVETPAADLKVTATAADQSLIENISITSGETGSTRQIVVTPANGKYGTTKITVEVKDAEGATTQQTFDFKVMTVPVATGETTKPVFLRNLLQISVTDLLANDTDADSNNLTITGLSNVTHGSATLDAANGLIVFQAEANYSGNASFDYTITDPEGNTATATATIPVISEIDLTTITNQTNLPVGVNGFTVFGAATRDASGWSVGGLQDVNNDGFGDLIIGARQSNPRIESQNFGAGKAFVVYGKPDGTLVQLSSVATGAGGYVLLGQNNGDQVGHEVSGTGDFNGDNIPDMIVGAPVKNQAYIVFGGNTTTPLSLNNLGTQGISLTGETSGSFGNSVSDAGDVNGDGLADVIVGSPGFSSSSGRAYVVFGTTQPSSVSISSVVAGNGGFVINSQFGPNTFTGGSVRSAGDVNGDGFADVIVGASRAQGSRGRSYVVFGGSGITNVNLSNISAGSGGFAIAGNEISMISGSSVSGAGDVNGDGLADLIISAPSAVVNGLSGAGKSYVVFGKTDGSLVNVSAVEAGTGGFMITGSALGDDAGTTVRAAGDINGDGLADVVVGGPKVERNGITDWGQAFVVFGKTDTQAVSVSSLRAGNGGFSLFGEKSDEYTGRSVRVAGDVNGDGFDDLVIGGRSADPNNVLDAGKSHVFFGGNSTGAVSQVGTIADDTLTGTSGNDILVGAAGNDILIGNGGIDGLAGGSGNDILAISSPNVGFIRGGQGIDTLRLDGGFSLDLTTIPDLRVTDIEQIDLAGSATNSLKLSRQEVLNLSSTSNRVLVKGITGNQLSLSDKPQWQAGGLEVVEGVTYNVYKQGLASLLVNPEISLL